MTLETPNGQVITGSVRLVHAAGMHARPAVKLTKLAKKFEAQISIRASDAAEWINAKSIAKVMALRRGSSLPALTAYGNLERSGQSQFGRCFAARQWLRRHAGDRTLSHVRRGAAYSGKAWTDGHAIARRLVRHLLGNGGMLDHGDATGRQADGSLGRSRPHRRVAVVIGGLFLDEILAALDLVVLAPRHDRH